MIKDMVMEPTLGQMAIFILENSRKITDMVKEPILIQMVKNNWRVER